ncbi:hypothetical protein D3C87_1636960 [compost metagenome]
MGARALHHGHLDAVLHQVGADIVSRIVRTDDHRALAAPGVTAGMAAGMMLLAIENLGTRISGNIGYAGHAGGENQLGRP